MQENKTKSWFVFGKNGSKIKFFYSTGKFDTKEKPSFQPFVIQYKKQLRKKSKCQKKLDLSKLINKFSKNTKVIKLKLASKINLPSIKPFKPKKFSTEKIS